MIKKKFVERIIVAMLCMAMISDINYGINAYAAENTGESDSAQQETFTDANQLTEIAGVLGGELDSKTGTIKLKSNITLTSNIQIHNTEAFTLDMNGYTITGKSIIFFNPNEKPITIDGQGAFTDCRINKWGAGQLNLDGDIVYTNLKDYSLCLREGTTNINNGTFYTEEKDVLWSDFDYECDYSYLYINGGQFHGNFLLSNNKTYIEDGTIDGTVNVFSGRLQVNGGTIKKGIAATGSSDEHSTITVSGGEVLDQIYIRNEYGSDLVMTGGIVKSNKDAVIKTNVHEGEEYCHSNITIKGGKIISTKKNGYGIKAVNTDIVITGGSFQNTTKKGKVAIYNERYHDTRKNVNVKNPKKVSFKGYKTNIKNVYKKNYCGKNVKYNLDKNGTLTISGKGEMFWAFDFSYINNEKLKDKIKKVVVKNGVTSVNGFAYCSKLKSVSLASSVKKIEDSAFYECRALEKISIKKGLESIGNYAFMYASKLKEINMPNTVTKIGDQAFYACIDLKKANISTNLTELSNSLFESCENLESIEIPSKITVIPYSAFRGCKKIKKVKLPKNLEVIDECAFLSCTSLTEIKIPSTVKKIDRAAFKNCKKLENIEIKITDDMIIDESAFDNTPIKGKIFT